MAGILFCQIARRDSEALWMRHVSDLSDISEVITSASVTVHTPGNSDGAVCLATGLNRLRDVVEHAAFLKPAGLDNSQHAFDQHAFDKEAALHTLGAERSLSPDHRMTKCSFGGVVGRFDALVINERPELLSMRVQNIAHARKPLVS